MAQPAAYLRAQDFSDWQTAHPDVIYDGTDLDAEFDRIKTTTDQIRTNLALIQRDDTRLTNSSVHAEAFDASALALMSSKSWTVKGTWLTATVYAVGDIVVNGTVTYVCAVAHTSGTFATDLAAVKWVAMGNALTSIAGSADKLPYFSGTNVVSLADLSAFARTLLDDASTTIFRQTLQIIASDERTITGNTTLTSSDIGKIIHMDATSAPLTATLPLCATVGKGAWIAIGKSDSSANGASVSRSTTDLFDDGRGLAKQRKKGDYAILVSDGVSKWTILGAVWTHDMIVYSTPGTTSFIRNDLPLGVRAIRAVCQAGGGGGGGGNSTTNWRGSGGSAGAYCEKTIQLTSMSSSETVTVGSGGAGGATGNPGAAGSNGTLSSFGSFCSAGPGLGGLGGTSTAVGGVAGGTATGGDINIPGSDSELGPSTSGVGVGPGADSILGGGGKINIANTASGYGAGGSCGNHTGGTGGAGSQGIVIVRF